MDTADAFTGSLRTSVRRIITDPSDVFAILQILRLVPATLRQPSPVFFSERSEPGGTGFPFANETGIMVTSIMARRFFIFAFAIVAVGLLLLVFYRNEPSYQGERLSDLAREYGSNHWSSSSDKAKRGQAAIQHIGADGVPFLLQAIATERSPGKKKLREVIPQKWHANLRLQDKSDETRRMGAYGIAALGTNAPAHVIPKLITIITTHPEEDSRYLAAFALRTLGPAAKPAIPFFVDCLKTNNDKFIRDEAAIALGSVQGQPEVTVPALMEFLKFAVTQEPSIFEARDAIDSLRQIGTNAYAALPLLRSLQSHNNQSIRTAAHFAVQSIDNSGNVFGLVPTY